MPKNGWNSGTIGLFQRYLILKFLKKNIAYEFIFIRLLPLKKRIIPCHIILFSCNKAYY